MNLVVSNRFISKVQYYLILNKPTSLIIYPSKMSFIIEIAILRMSLSIVAQSDRL